jgi:hypothetical protein
VAKLTRLTHKIAIQLHLVVAVPFALLAPGGQSGNFWVHPRISEYESYEYEFVRTGDMFVAYCKILQQTDL